MALPVDEKVIYRAFGSRVSKRRGEVGLTQLQVANAIGISRATIANVEKGKHNLPLHQVYRLSLALGLQDVCTLLPPLPAAAANDLSVAAPGLAIHMTDGNGGVNDAARRQIAKLWDEIGVEGP